MNADPATGKDHLLDRIVRQAERKGFLDFDDLVCQFPTEASADQTKLLIDKLHELKIPICFSRTDRSTVTRSAARLESGLLTREQEVELARQIRAGHRRRIRAALRSPRTIEQVVRAAGQVAAGRRRLWDVLSDYEGTHPDEEDHEALARLGEVAANLRRHQAELARLETATAARKDRPDRRKRIGAVRSAMARQLSQLDFRDEFVGQLIRPLSAEAARVEQSRAQLFAIEDELGLARGALGDTAQIPDPQIRDLLRGLDLDRQATEDSKRRVKKHKRSLRSAAQRTAMSPAELLDAVAEIRRGEREANEARQAMVEANQRLVISIARRYPHHSMDFLDLVQEGNLGLMRAADRFDPERGFRFGTYAAWWVRQSIGRLVAEQGSAVRIPPHVQELLHKVNRITRRLVLKSGREPTVEELAESLDKTPERIKEILNAGRRPISTESQVGDAEDSAKLLDFLPDPHAGPDEEADRRVQQAVLQDAMSALTERERDIIGLRFQQGLTLQEVGERYSITRERTRQLEAQALRKLRKRLKADLLRKLIRDEPLRVCEEPPAERPTGRGPRRGKRPTSARHKRKKAER